MDQLNQFTDFLDDCQSGTTRCPVQPRHWTPSSSSPIVRTARRMTPQMPTTIVHSCDSISRNIGAHLHCQVCGNEEAYCVSDSLKRLLAEHVAKNKERAATTRSSMTPPFSTRHTVHGRCGQGSAEQCHISEPDLSRLQPECGVRNGVEGVAHLLKDIWLPECRLHLARGKACFVWSQSRVIDEVAGRKRCFA